LKTSRKNKKGFTLIETIVAFAIIAVILVVALVGFNTIANTSNRAQAWNQADQTLENMIAKAEPGTFTAEPKTLVVYQNGAPVATIKGELRTFEYEGRKMEVFYADPNQ